METSDNVTVGPWEEVEPPVTLADVGGMEEVKKRLNIAFLAPMKNPELMKMYGKSLKGGMMLYGPPGCGKTFIARALAGELGAKFMTIGLSDVLDMWLGESERKLHEIFEAARRNAPTVVFFDEIDALGQKRSQLRHSAGRNIVNQLLAEMDSVGSDNKNVFILAATNHPWDVDTALRRPGRFDRVVLVLPPARTELFSGADIAHLCESAVEYALEESLTTGTTRPVISADFDKALKEIRPSTRPWFETARNYAMFANEGGVYDDLLNYIRAQKL
ncbi:MAG: cell division protein FtsH [Gammaproteobacteria bacterium SG8_11]|nr:MAG: cell division protein FtsH [Gammaproteobacteria bacterium SG8_11]